MIAVATACLGFLIANPPLPSPTAEAAAPVDARSAGLRGLVYHRGLWVRPDEVADLEARDASLAAARAEYADRREKAPGTAAGQRALASWCEAAGLKVEALAHYHAVTRLDSEDEPAQRKLGRRRYRGGWMTEGEVAAEADGRRAQALADRAWGPKIAAWREQLADPATKVAAGLALAEVRDPRAVPSIRRSFADRIPWEQDWAIRLLGQIDAPASTRELAGLSVRGIDEPVRLAALARLRRRDPLAFVGLLINWLREPIRYQLEPATSGLEATAGLRVEGTQSIVERLYRAEPSGAESGRWLGFDPRSQGGARREMASRPRADNPSRRLRIDATNPAGQAGEDARRAVLDRRREDVRELDRANVTVELTNERITRALIQTTGMSLGADGQAWASWWTGEMGYSYESPGRAAKPVVTETVSVAYTSPAPIVNVQPVYSGIHHNCFAAGTPVLSRGGPRPIEDLRVGDQVLTQESDSGALEFRPILAIFHNRPSPTLRVELGGESIVSTPIHRFWLAGRGWAMARDLRPGDHVRSLDGPARVESVTPSPVQPVFNLEVADGHSFFVGRGRALVHDNSLVNPAPVAFDAGSRSIRPGR